VENSNDLRNIFYRSDKKYDAKAGCGVCATLRDYTVFNGYKKEQPRFLGAGVRAFGYAPPIKTFEDRHKGIVDLNHH
jgi:hypothetical protein